MSSEQHTRQSSRLSQAGQAHIYDRVYRAQQSDPHLMGTRVLPEYNIGTKVDMIRHICQYSDLRAPTLEIGAGDGDMTALVDQYTGGDMGRYVAIDISEFGLRIAQKKGSIYPAVGDMGQLPFHDGSFVNVLAADALEHGQNPTATIGEIARVLKPNGILTASLPHPSAFRNLALDIVAKADIPLAYQICLSMVKRRQIMGKVAFQPVENKLELREWQDIMHAHHLVPLDMGLWPNHHLPMAYIISAQKTPTR